MLPEVYPRRWCAKFGQLCGDAARDTVGERPMLFQPSLFGIAVGLDVAPTFGSGHDGADDKKHDINQIMLAIDVRTSFFNDGQVLKAA